MPKPCEKASEKHYNQIIVTDNFLERLKETNGLIPILSFNKNQRKRSRHIIDNSVLQPLIINQDHFFKSAVNEIGSFTNN